jgi:hypothetical protein
MLVGAPDTLAKRCAPAQRERLAAAQPPRMSVASIGQRRQVSRSARRTRFTLSLRLRGLTRTGFRAISSGSSATSTIVPSLVIVALM